jgi:TPR repeat protein
VIACGCRGDLCRKGRPPDAIAARALFKQAADRGDNGGVCGLAYMHTSGLGGLPVDVEGAKAMYQRVAAAGDPRGNCGLGWLYIGCVCLAV